MSGITGFGSGLESRELFAAFGIGRKKLLLGELLSSKNLQRKTILLKALKCERLPKNLFLSSFKNELKEEKWTSYLILLFFGLFRGTFALSAFHCLS